MYIYITAKGSTLCTWCDPDAMAVALATKPGRTKISKALTMFQKSNATHAAALAVLPPEWSTGRGYYCHSPKCVFNVNDRRPARAKSSDFQGAIFCK